MARRDGKNIDSEISAENISTENINPENKENEMTENPENVNPENVNPDNPENPDSVENPEIPEIEEKASDEADPYIPVERLEEITEEIYPDYKSDPNKMGQAMLSRSFIEMAITFRNSYLDARQQLQSASFDDSLENVIKLAQDTKTQEKSVLIAPKLQDLLDAQKKLNEELAELTAEIKTALNITHLTDENKEILTKDANEAYSSVADTIKNMESFERMNPGQSIQGAIDYLKSLPALPELKGKRTIAPTAEDGKSHRPRLGEKHGGFIKIGEKNFKNFAEATAGLKAALKHTGKKSHETLTVTELHTAWYNAAGVSFGNYQDVPAGKEITFDFDGIPVTIKRMAAPA